MITENNRMYISKELYDQLTKQEYGHGTDGFVFKYNKDYLLKFYRSAIQKEYSSVKDDSDMRIAHIGDKIKFKAVRGKIDFRTQEKIPVERINPDGTTTRDIETTFTRLNDEEALGRIREKQKKVTKTRLPEKLIYVDNRLVGVLLHKVKGVQIHKLTGMPLEYKKKVMHAILEAVQELLDNNIYHIDLANSPHAIVRTTEEGKPASYGHSHILLNPFTMKANIIDLDGQSTVYTDYYDQVLEEYVLENLTTLIIEFFYGIDPNEYEQDDDMTLGTTYSGSDLLSAMIQEYGIRKELADKASHSQIETMDEIKELVDSATKKR